MPVTLRDIAKRLNLSHATVSFVLNDRRDVAIPEATRQRVWQAAREMGYRPNRAAQALVKGKTNIVAVWTPSICHRYYAEVLDAVSVACRRHGIETLYHRADFDDLNVRPFAWPIDGVIAVDVRDLLVKGPAPESTPVISVGAFVDERHDHIKVDLTAGAFEAVSHLVRNAGGRVIHVKTNDREDGRDEGYRGALAAYGASPELVIADSREPIRIRQAVREHVRRNGVPDAIFGGNDLTALAAMAGMADLGLRAPHDYLIAGFDGIREGELNEPSLTTVCQPIEAMATRAVELLLARLEEPTAPRFSETLVPNLVARGTTTRTLRIAASA